MQMPRARVFGSNSESGSQEVSEVPRICKRKKYEILSYSSDWDRVRHREVVAVIMREGSSAMGLRWLLTQHWCRSRLNADWHLGVRS